MAEVPGRRRGGSASMAARAGGVRWWSAVSTNSRGKSASLVPLVTSEDSTASLTETSAAAAAFAASLSTAFESRAKENENTRIAPFVPAPDPVIAALLGAVPMLATDVVLDVGAGDGRVLAAAVRDGKAGSGIGVELEGGLVEASKAVLAKGTDVSSKVKMVTGDVRDVGVDFLTKEATVVVSYMGTVGTRVLSSWFAKHLLVPEGDKPVPGLKVRTLVSVDHELLAGEGWGFPPTRTIVVGSGDSAAAAQDAAETAAASSKVKADFHLYVYDFQAKK